MPTYLYSDGKHRQEITHGMMEAPLIVCKVCGKPMHKVPQAFRVNWNGLPPHLESARPKFMNELIGGADRRRAAYLENKELQNGKKKD